MTAFSSNCRKNFKSAVRPVKVSRNCAPECGIKPKKPELTGEHCNELGNRNQSATKRHKRRKPRRVEPLAAFVEVAFFVFFAFSCGHFIR
jgi:hypothetical protein